MNKPTIAIHNIETNEIIEREMNDAELELYNARIAANEVQETIAEAKATAKAALLAQLGITEEQAKLLLS
jgi:hypothetical protein